jgi:ATP-dependent phosphofructokinase / diphosphate-dependent phosphofructokinase
MVSIQHGRCMPIPFMPLVDPVSGWANVRRVDSTAQSYQIARQCMIRLSEVGTSRVPRHLAAARPSQNCRRRHFTAGFTLSVRTW